MATYITILVDDRPGRPCMAAEHGLALWIEHEGRKVIFDTGASGRVLLANAADLGIRLEEAEAVCLSHGHSDHTGGLGAVLPRLRGASVLAHPAAFEPKYAKTREGWRPIGMSLSQDAIAAMGIRVSLAEGPQPVLDGGFLTGEVPRDGQLAPQTPHLYREGASGREIDPFRDDQALVLCTAEGLVVVSGCAHAGVINHCRAALRRVPGARVRAIVGGFHLVGASADLLGRTIEALRELGVEAIHPGHCTGEAAVRALAAAFPGRCAPYAVGARLEFR